MWLKYQREPGFCPSPANTGFRLGLTLVELVVVLVMIVVSIALCCLFVETAQHGPTARGIQCVNNMKQIGLALQNYQTAYGAFPPAYTVDAQGRPLHSWRTLILPYLEQDALYRTIDLAKPWNDPANAKALAAVPSAYHCPSSDGPQTTTTYLALVGPDACFLATQPRRLAEITDPHETTLMFIEAAEENAVPWMAPLDADESQLMRFSTNLKLHHSAGTNAAMVDGSIKFLRATTPAAKRRAMISISSNDNDLIKE